MKYIQVPNFNPNIFSIGFLQIRWYSLAYVVAIILAWKLMSYCNTKYNLRLYTDKNKDKFCDDFFFYSVLGIVLGGRLGYVLFYNFQYYFSHPLDIFKIWEGGMSFHGGLIGSCIAMKLICKKYRIKLFRLSDVLALCAPIGLFFGRIANFINLELYGRITSVKWAMIFPNTDGMPRHPSQLYEAFLEGVLLFCILLFTSKKYKFKVKGLNSGIFLTCYGLFRMFAECFREPDIQLGNFLDCLTMGQILSFPIFILGVLILNRIRVQNIKIKKHLKR